MKILVTNDDGWDAPGIELLESVLEEYAEVWTVAPATPQSGISHQMTFERPMNLTRRQDRRYHLDGTPADCARVGLTQLGEDFDWVFSGVNNGGNLGVDFFISGTVAAAREATFFGNKAVAISQHRLNYPAQFDWEAVRPLLQRVVEDVLGQRALSAGDLVNFNLPDCTERDIESVQIVECDLDRSPLPFDYGRQEGDYLKEGYLKKGGYLEGDDPKDSSPRDVRQTLLYKGRYNDRQRAPKKDVDVCLSGNVSAVVVRAS